MLGHNIKPCTHLTSHRCTSQAMLACQLIILTLHMLPIPRQHICNNVVVTRYILGLQIKFGKSFQPMCLARIEVGLNKDANKRLMIGLHVTDIAMQVVMPLHAP